MKQVKKLYLSVLLSFVACDLKVGGYRCIEMCVRVIKVNVISWLEQRIVLNISVKTTFAQKPLDQLKATFMCSFLKNTNKTKFM